jgi:outer membrane protein assembly factor BamB
MIRSPFAIIAIAACAMWQLPAAATASTAAGSAHLAGRAAHSARAAGSSAFDWAEFHRSKILDGYAANSSLSTANASQLGVAWATNLYGAALDSPVVAYDATRKQTLAYIGTERGDVIAVNVANGRMVWATWVGGEIRATPVVSGGSVFIGALNSARVYKLNASTGAVQCSVSSPQPIEGTPVIATPPGGTSTLYVGTNDSINAAGPVLAVKTSNCKMEWKFTGFRSVSGSWTPVSYAVDAKGRPLIVFGSADLDAGVYAVNAVTGKKAWSFFTLNPAPHVFDVGAGPVMTPPSASDSGGTVYVPTKFGIMYALNLTTGKQIWNNNFNQALNVHEGGRSTPALDGTSLVFGYNGGMADIDTASHTALKWHTADPAKTEVLSSPAIAGPSGSEIVAAGDLAGGVDVDSLATGAQLYHYQTGGYITASPAVSDGNIVIASSDGFLYDFAAGGGNESTPPGTAVTAPSNFASLANPNGNQKITGTATDSAGIAGVQVAIQEGGTNGPWWDAAAKKWVSGSFANPATVASTGTGVTSSNWTFSYPVPSAGGTYTVTANTASTTGGSDIKGGNVRFSVLATTSGAHLSSGSRFAPPGATVRLTGGGFGKSEKIAISLAGKSLTTVTSGAKGAVSSKVVIPGKAQFGLTSLTAKGKTSGKSATAAISVANSWDQEGDNAGHTGFEPNDSSLFNLVHIGPNLFLDPAWQYQSGAPINTAPAVADAVAYTGNSAGQLSAIDINNGAPLWSKTITSAAIGGSPAVDPSKALVFAGANDGNVYAVKSPSGNPAWHTLLKGPRGNVSAPVLGSGEVYASTSTGTVEAMSEATGRATWSRQLGVGITAAPSLDTGNGTLVVSESSGRVVALHAATGKTKWTFSSGGAVAAPAMISGGTVYFGSADHSVYAVSEKTGKKVWSHPTGGAVADTPVITDQGTPGGVHELVVGSSDGTMYAIKASNGSEIFHVAFNHPIVGVVACRGVAIITTSTGLAGGSRTYSDLRVWGFQTGGAITSPPVVVDGAVYVGSGDGKLYSFTTFGQLPTSSPMQQAWG